MTRPSRALDPAEPPEPHRIRLQRWLAQCGLGSRRACEDLIRQGRVALNGRVITRLGTTLDPATDDVAVDGRTVRPPQKKGPSVWAFHKPAGVTSTLADPHATTTLADAFPPELRKTPGRRFPIGRLDRQSEGLLLLTDDGTLAHRLTHPRFHVEKQYEALIEPALSQETLNAWEEGIEVPALEEEHAEQGIILLRAKAWPAGKGKAADGRGHPRIRLILREGRKRQIRRMVQASGSRVLRLRRTRIGPVKLGNLAPGTWRRLRGPELQQLLEATSA